ncbi:MAG: HAMP domain-containing protein, partial [Abitibacteriaceae bacterium]|nr:HAMP domain-containing protein [Abditibacteriaceae bacterium]
MRSLFIKIFLWFWLAMALVGAVIWVSLPPRPQPESARWREIAPDVLNLYGQSAIQVYERQGADAAMHYLEDLNGTTHVHVFFFDERGNELTERPLPPGVDILVERAALTGKEEFEAQGPMLRAAQRVVSPNGHRYILVGEIPRGRLQPLGGPIFPFLQVLAVFLTAGAVCYGLVRYLTAPIIDLRQATRRFAEGDFGARVGNVVEQRRDELGDLGRDFNSMAARIQALMNAQRRLLADVSHELRSPLARLGVALELARDQDTAESGNAELRKALDRSEREVGRLNELISQLLTLSRLESGVPLAERTPVDLTRLVHEIASDADFEARNRSRSVRVVESCQCATDGAEELLRSAIENVVRNAVRYTAEDTEVKIVLRREAALDGASDCCVIAIRDKGVGVPETELTDLFRPFYRVGNARERKTGGVGLGLAIT